VKLKADLYRMSVLILSLLCVAAAGRVFLSDRLYSAAMRDAAGAEGLAGALGRIGAAIRVCPENAEYLSEKCGILMDIMNDRTSGRSGVAAIQKSKIPALIVGTVKRSIDLCPTWAKYHVLYAFYLKRLSPDGNFMTRALIRGELKKAAELNPYYTRYKGSRYVKKNKTP
jgi:hypothetical protein